MIFCASKVSRCICSVKFPWSGLRRSSSAGIPPFEPLFIPTRLSYLSYYREISNMTFPERNKWRRGSSRSNFLSSLPYLLSLHFHGSKSVSRSQRCKSATICGRDWRMASFCANWWIASSLASFPRTPRAPSTTSRTTSVFFSVLSLSFPPWFDPFRRISTNFCPLVKKLVSPRAIWRPCSTSANPRKTSFKSFRYLFSLHWVPFFTLFSHFSLECLCCRKASPSHRIWRPNSWKEVQYYARGATSPRRAKRRRATEGRRAHCRLWRGTFLVFHL